MDPLDAAAPAAPAAAEGRGACTTSCARRSRDLGGGRFRCEEHGVDHQCSDDADHPGAILFQNDDCEYVCAFSGFVVGGIMVNVPDKYINGVFQPDGRRTVDCTNMEFQAARPRRSGGSKKRQLTEYRMSRVMEGAYDSLAEHGKTWNLCAGPDVEASLEKTQLVHLRMNATVILQKLFGEEREGMARADLERSMLRCCKEVKPYCRMCKRQALCVNWITLYEISLYTKTEKTVVTPQRISKERVAFYTELVMRMWIVLRRSHYFMSKSKKPRPAAGAAGVSASAGSAAAMRHAKKIPARQFIMSCLRLLSLGQETKGVVFVPRDTWLAHHVVANESLLNVSGCRLRQREMTAGVSMVDRALNMERCVRGEESVEPLVPLSLMDMPGVMYTHHEGDLRRKMEILRREVVYWPMSLWAETGTGPGSAAAAAGE